MQPPSDDNPLWEISVFCMTGDHPTTRDEDVEYYDIRVRFESEDREVEEFENLTQEQIDELLPILEARYGVAADIIDGA